MRQTYRILANIKPKKAMIVVILLFLVMPILAIGSHRHKIFVDDNNNGTQDGSYKHPYKTIKDAMKKADDDTNIYVANGEYDENVEIKDGVRLYGQDREKTIIKAKDDDEPAVKMEHKTKISKFTVKNGDDGIKVKDNSMAEIVQCLIKNNDEDGVDIEEGSVRDARKVVIYKSEIRDNGKAGVYSRKRYVVITNNEIIGNGDNGIDIEKNSEAWIAKNEVKKNGGSGFKFRIDGSGIYTKKNSVVDNDRSGAEIVFSGDSGRVDLKRSEFSRNNQYGVARIQKGNFPKNLTLWNRYLTFTDGVSMESNKDGGLSDIIVK